MDLDALVAAHPTLYHMAEAGSWESIRSNGLLTTRQQVERCRPDPALATQILGDRRPETVQLDAPDGHRVSIRDQKPLKLHNLTLADCDLQGWLDILNGSVFFWPDEDRLRTLMGARPYRDRAHDIISVDCARLVERHWRDIRLSQINSGATIFPNSRARGPATFVTIEEFPDRAASGRSRQRVVEVAVIGGVHDIADLVIAVETRQA